MRAQVSVSYLFSYRNQSTQPYSSSGSSLQCRNSMDALAAAQGNQTSLSGAPGGAAAAEDLTSPSSRSTSWLGIDPDEGASSDEFEANMGRIVRGAPSGQTFTSCGNQGGLLRGCGDYRQPLVSRSAAVQWQSDDRHRTCARTIRIRCPLDPPHIDSTSIAATQAALISALL